MVEDPADLLKIDFSALDAGDRSAVAELDHTFPDTPLLGVCTNGKRDACCATVGRQVAIAAEALEAASGASADAPFPAVWEITHLGGHRFAPTAVVLPSGYSYGRLDAASATRVLADARRGRMAVPECRGRSTWSRPGQAAELAVRAALDETAENALEVVSVTQTAPDPAPAWTVAVEHEDGRAYEVSVTGSLATVPRPESCGKAAGTPLELRADRVDKIR